MSRARGPRELGAYPEVLQCDPIEETGFVALHLGPEGLGSEHLSLAQRR